MYRSSAILVFLTFSLAVSWAAPPVLYETDFSRCAEGTLPSEWWAEGSRAVAVRAGRLVQDANPDGSGEDAANSVVWLDRVFDGDLRLEFDAQVVSAQGEVNDIVVFFLFSDPSGRPLRETRAARASGKQGLYTKTMNGYVLFWWGKGGVTKPANIRLRDCPGGNLLVEKNAYEVRTGKIYHFAIEKRASRLSVAVDGTTYLEHDASKDNVPNPVHSGGLIGFKTWNTEMQWDNIRVTRIIGQEKPQ